jgi:membrane protein DedA with SNARE-associated domain
MQAYLDQIGLFIEINQAWAGPVVFLLTFGESLFIVGVLLPATALLLFAGGLIGSGLVPPTTVLLWGVAGAIAGDAISFWMGRWVGPTILRWRAVKRQRPTVARARLFFYRYGFLSIFVGRFLGPVRCTIPTVAGVMGMSQWRFQLANILSAMAWVPLMLLPGYLAVKSVHMAKHANQLMLYVGGGLSIVIGVSLLYLFTRQRKTPRARSKGREQNNRHEEIT